MNPWEIVPVEDVSLEEYFEFRKLAAHESAYVNALDFRNCKLMIAGWSTDAKQGFVLLHNDKIVGQLFLQPDYPEKGVLFISLISVLKVAQGTKAASLLIQKTEAVAKDHHCHQVKLIVNEFNSRAIAFYTKQGFKHTDDFRKGKWIFTKLIH